MMYLYFWFVLILPSICVDGYSQTKIRYCRKSTFLLSRNGRAEAFSEADVLDFKYIPQNDIDEALYHEFLTQISNDFSVNKSKRIVPRQESKNMQSSQIASSVVVRGVQEEPTVIEQGAPLEIIYKRKLLFGNFLSYKKDSHSIEVLLQSEEKVFIDVGQVISVWDTLADDTPPKGPEMWADVASEALEILGHMSPRKSNLEEFWTKMERRRTDMAVDSMDLGIYIFQEHNFRRWMDPHLQSGNLHVHALSAAQRYAAALLLFFDDLHFKRRSSVHISGLGSRGSLIEGGYRALDEGTVIFKQGDLFVNYASNLMNQTVANQASTSPFSKSCIARTQRALEAYALSPQSTRSKAATKHILKRLNMPDSPMGAKQLLMKLVGDSKVNAVGGTSSTTSDNQKKIEITLWPKSVLAAANDLATFTVSRRQALKEKTLPKAGKRGPNGRVDFRASEHPVMCVDTRRTSFYDDGFSLSPETGEILIHISDVMETLSKYQALRDVSRERVVSVFTPQGPLHMLPPLALDSLRLSPDDANEAITVGISVEFSTGRLLGCRLLPSLISRVTVINTESANEILGEFDQYGETRIVPGVPEAAVKDLILAHKLIGEVIEANPWVDEHYSRTGRGRKAVVNRVTGVYSYESVDLSPAGRLINALLTLYSNSSAVFCEQQGLSLPIAWENRDRAQPELVRRFGSQPLRSWLSQMQQLQLRAALRLNNPLTRDDCALIVTHVNNHRQQQASFKQRSQKQEDFLAFANHCESIHAASNSGDIYFEGELVNNNLVRLIGYNVQGRIVGYLSKSNSSPELGSKVKVRVKQISIDSGSVTFDLVG